MNSWIIVLPDDKMWVGSLQWKNVQHLEVALGKHGFRHTNSRWYGCCKYTLTHHSKHAMLTFVIQYPELTFEVLS